MKRIICLLICVLVLFCGCSKSPDYDLEVAEEPFENINIEPSGMGSYPRYANEQEIYDDCDLVVIAMPINTYTDEKVIFTDAQGNELSQDEDWRICSTLRELKVIEILKGDKSITEVTMTQLGGIITDENGEQKSVCMSPNDFIQKKNVKYIYYLKKDLGNNDYYYSCPDQGVINIDGLDTKAGEKASADRVAQTMKRHSGAFEKYDRTSEIASYKSKETKNISEYDLEVTEEPFESYNSLAPKQYDYETFDSEEELYEASDIVIVGMPVNTISDDKRMYYSEQSPLLTESGEWNKACTVRDINVVEVIKGDKSLENIQMIYNAGHVDAEMFGTPYYIGVPTEEPISKKNVKYIYYLTLDEGSGDTRYRVTGTQSVLNIDGLHTQTYDYLSGKMMTQMARKYADLFKKYDRT